jgi:hypothetical protein
MAVTTSRVALYFVSRLVLSPVDTRPAAQQQLRVSWGGWAGWWDGVVGGPGHYVVTPIEVEVELGSDDTRNIISYCLIPYILRQRRSLW